MNYWYRANGGAVRCIKNWKCTKYPPRPTCRRQAGGPLEIGSDTYLKLFHRASGSVYFYGISTMFHFKTTYYLILATCYLSNVECWTPIEEWRSGNSWIIRISYPYEICLVSCLPVGRQVSRLLLLFHADCLMLN